MSFALHPTRPAPPRRARAEKKAPRRHRLANLVQNQAYKLVFAHTGKFQIIAWYYAVTQWLKGQLVNTTVLGRRVRFRLPDVKGHWDNLLSADWHHGGLVRLMSRADWDPMRHLVFRGLIESVLGIMLYQQIGFDVEKYDARLKERGPGVYDRVVLAERRALGRTWTLNWALASAFQEGPVTGPQYAFLPLIVVGIAVVVGLPLYLGVHYGLHNAAHWKWLEPHISAHAPLWQKLYEGDFDGFLVGIPAGILAARSYRPYLYANTMNYSRSWVARGRRAHWWMPKPTRDLVRDLCAQGRAAQRRVLSERSGASRAAAWTVLVLGVAATAYGYYLFSTVAH